MVKKLYIILYVILLATPIYAYTFTYPTPYYYDKENIKVDMDYIELFKDFTPDYLRDRLEIEFTTKQSNYYGYCYCYSKPNGRIVITMYRDSWIEYDYAVTSYVLYHELRHAYQCRILDEYPDHKEDFYKITL